jgi:hypothetical protein
MCNNGGGGDGDNGGSNNCMCNNGGGGDGDNGGSNNCMCNNGGSGDGDSNGGNSNCTNNGNNNGNNNVVTGSAELDIDWGNAGTIAPFKVLDAQHLDLDVTNPGIGAHHQIEVDPREIDIRSLATDPSVVPATTGMTVFSITGQHGDTTQNFQSFGDFEAALAADLNGTTTALRMTAEGQYSAAGNVFTARRISVLLTD